MPCRTATTESEIGIRKRARKSAAKRYASLLTRTASKGESARVTLTRIGLEKAGLNHHAHLCAGFEPRDETVGRKTYSNKSRYLQQDTSDSLNMR